MSAVKLVWATPEIDKIVGYLARVSNPKAKPEDPYEKLINYLIGHKHWSPLEMANICIEINTTRDIARQILRHRSFHFQEFSQRYAEADEQPVISDKVRLQDTKNRQNSIPTEDVEINAIWAYAQNLVWDTCWWAYKLCLGVGIAKELARKLLPEGLTRTKMYVNGTVRDWYHYLSVRTGAGTQLEHIQLAWAIATICEDVAPCTFLNIVGDGG